MTPKTSFTKQKAGWKVTMTPNPKTIKRCATAAKKAVPAKKASATAKYQLKNIAHYLERCFLFIGRTV